MPETILQVITDTDRRGAQGFATALHTALEARGRVVRTVALAAGAVGGLDWPTLGPSRKHPTTFRNLRRATTDASVVIAHGSTTLPMCALVRATTSTPFVYRQISESTFWAPSRARRLRVRAALSMAAGVVALWRGSASTLHETFGVPFRKLDVIPNGVPPERVPPIDRSTMAEARTSFGLAPDRATVLSIGALVPEKGVDLTIDAVGHLPEVQLLVAGDGPARGELEARARATVPDRVVFAGSVPDPRTAFEAADVVVLPSRGGDSMPAVLIEAGFMGVPTVATPVEGIGEILDEGRAGVLVAKDDVGSLVAGIERVLTETTHAAALAAAAREHCLDHYAIDVVAARWDAMLSRVRR